MSGLGEFDDKVDMVELENVTEQPESWKLQTLIVDTIKNFMEIKREAHEDLLCDTENITLKEKYSNGLIF
jgi:hypothetical protein